jgi:hypothetical protein
MEALAYIESLRPNYVREDHRLTKKSRMLACKILRMLRKYFSTSSGKPQVIENGQRYKSDA